MQAVASEDVPVCELETTEVIEGFYKKVFDTKQPLNVNTNPTKKVIDGEVPTAACMLESCSDLGGENANLQEENVCDVPISDMSESCSDLGEDDGNFQEENICDAQNGNVNEIKDLNGAEKFEGIQYNAIVNDQFDTDFDMLIETLQNEVKERNCDILVDDAGGYDDVQTAILEEVEEVIESQTFTKLNKSSEEFQQKESDTGSKELYSGSPFSLGVVILLICTFIIRFRLPDEALSYFLRILVCILPQNHRLMGTIYHFRKFLKEYTSNMLPKIFYFCSYCYSEINRQSKKCPSCSKSLSGSGSIAYFVQMKIVSQLMLLWKNSVFTSAVRSNRFKHYEGKRNKNTIGDVYDGTIYKRLFENGGILSDKNNLSFALNTDGVPIFKSSNIGLWPVYLLINELPMSMRKQRDFSVFYGAWISSRKPQMWSFLKPLYEELAHLESEGYEFTDDNGDKFISKCVLLTCTCDLPARALVYNSIQFNGKYSCWYCLEQGETCKLDTGGSCHVFPFNRDNPKNEPRTKETVSQDIRSVFENIEYNSKDYLVRGHKGPFWFFYLKHFDVINSCVIDYMHGICLGIMKTLLSLWFDKSKRNKTYSIHEAKDKVNNLLLQVKPTVFVTRVPRNLDTLCHWKSSEFRNFLLYWGAPVLRHFLKKEYFAHFCLLVRAIYLLSKENITETDLKVAEGALFLFVECFQNLYELRYSTLNLHQLVHLVDCVKHTGPLFVNNCFIFEDLNGYVVKHIHGTQGIDTQLVNIVTMLKITPLLYEKYLKTSENSDAIQLYLELNDSVMARHTFQDEIEDGIRPVGSFKWKQLEREDFEMASIYGISSSYVKVFYKVNMYKRGFYIYGSDYRKLSKRQQHIATYTDKSSMEFCSVKYFIMADKNGSRNLAVVETFEKVETFGSVWQVKVLNHKKIIPISSITNVNNVVRVQDEIYICPPPNRYDRD